MKAGPCKGCLDRKLGCHGVCVAYQDWKIERAAELDWLAEQRPQHREHVRKREDMNLRKAARGWGRKR